MIMLTKIGGVIRTLVKTWWRWLLIALVGKLTLYYTIKPKSPFQYYSIGSTGVDHKFLLDGEKHRKVTKSYSTRARVYNGVAAAIPLVLLILCIVLMVGVL